MSSHNICFCGEIRKNINSFWFQLTLYLDQCSFSFFQVTQTELVLKVFLRLVEDILTFHNVPQFRRREIMNALSANTTELCGWFISLLQEHSTKAAALVPIFSH